MSKKLVVLTNFAELGHDLNEFPEFLRLADQVGLKNFADALNEFHQFSLSRDRKLIQILAQFILWLGMAAVGDYRVLVGKQFKFFNRYETMPILIPEGRLEIYRQAKELYDAALRVSKGKRA